MVYIIKQEEPKIEKVEAPVEGPQIQEEPKAVEVQNMDEVVEVIADGKEAVIETEEYVAHITASEPVEVVTDDDDEEVETEPVEEEPVRVDENGVKWYNATKEDIDTIKQAIVDAISMATEPVKEVQTVQEDVFAGIPVEEPLAVVKPAEEVPIEITEEVVRETVAELLKPAEPVPSACPFCGAEVQVAYYHRWHVVGHKPDCILGPNAKAMTREQVIDAWNRRA